MTIVAWTCRPLVYMPKPKLTQLELKVLEALWQKGVCSVREVQEAFPESKRPAYTTVQTVVYRLERKKAVRCVKRISNANIFEAAISRQDAQRRLVDDLMALFDFTHKQNKNDTPLIITGGI